MPLTDNFEIANNRPWNKSVTPTIRFSCTTNGPSIEHSIHVVNVDQFTADKSVALNRMQFAILSGLDAEDRHDFCQFAVDATYRRVRALRENLLYFPSPNRPIRFSFSK